MSAQPAADGLYGLRVFVVEDEGPVAMLLESMLEDLGCVVVASAASVPEALGLADRGGFDLALLDVNLAGEKVFPVADRLRVSGAPFVFTSGYGSAGIRPDLDGIPVVQKPYTLSDLKAALVAATPVESRLPARLETSEPSTMSNLEPVALSRSVKLAGSELTCSCHACAFFSSDDEEQAVLAPFAKEGLAANDRLVQIINQQHREDRARRLKAEGVDVGAAAQVSALPGPHLQLPAGGGGFDQDAMLALIQEVLKEGRSSGFAMTRLWANMEWALEDLPGVDQIVEYETRLNHVLPQYDDVVVCTYDLNKFSAATVMDILRTHPQVIVGGVLQQNPFFVPPDQFLAELQDRKKSA